MPYRSDLELILHLDPNFSEPCCYGDVSIVHLSSPEFTFSSSVAASDTRTKGETHMSDLSGLIYSRRPIWSHIITELVQHYPKCEPKAPQYPLTTVRSFT